jgi:hypothetical protein
MESEDGIMHAFLNQHFSQRRGKRREIILQFFALEWSIYEMSPRYKMKSYFSLTRFKERQYQRNAK